LPNREGYQTRFVRRAYHRFEAGISVTLISEGDIRKPSIIKDLSSRGAGLVTNYSLRQDETIDVVFNPSFFFESGINKAARVIWCEKIGTALWQGGLDFGEGNKLKFE